MKRALLWAALCALVGCGDGDAPLPGSGVGASSMTPTCDFSPLPADLQSAVGSVACVNGPKLFDVHFSAKPLGPIGAETAFKVQAQLVIHEDSALAIRQTIPVGLVEGASVELNQLGGKEPTTLGIQTPCIFDAMHDQDADGTLGPTAMTTEVDSAVWSVINGSITIEATDVSFVVSGGPCGSGCVLSTNGPDPNCTWVDVPRLTFGVDATSP